MTGQDIIDDLLYLYSVRLDEKCLYIERTYEFFYVGD